MVTYLGLVMVPGPLIGITDVVYALAALQIDVSNVANLTARASKKNLLQLQEFLGNKEK